MDIKSIIYEKLTNKGASIVGFSNISGLPLDCRFSMQSAVSIAVALNSSIVSEICNGPTINYYKEYERVNQFLSELGSEADRILKSNGYESIALAVTEIGIDSNLSTKLPHKTAATRAGIGWIGKSALLITKEYGCAIRLTTVLTSANFGEAEPINSSLCGNCKKCVNACPGKAIRGINWEINSSRESIYDAFICRETTLKQAEKIGVDNTICGICIAVCPWTKRYYRKNR